MAVAVAIAVAILFLSYAIFEFCFWILSVLSWMLDLAGGGRSVDAGQHPGVKNLPILPGLSSLRPRTPVECRFRDVI